MYLNVSTNIRSIVSYTAVCVIFFHHALYGEKYIRGIWITAWKDGISTQRQADKTIKDLQNSSINTVFLQVRKTADAYYRSSIEPMAPEIQKGFDPLRYFIDNIGLNKLGEPIEIHAWLVMYRAWKFSGPSKTFPPKHLLSLRPDWIMKEHRGSYIKNGNVFIDPGIPQVNLYLTDIVLDLCDSYPVAGVHLDYIRYPEDPDTIWGYSPRALEAYQKETGRTRPSLSDKHWTAWRREQVTELLRLLRQKVTPKHPDMVLSAAVVAWGKPSWHFSGTRTYKEVFQDIPTWLNEGLLDMVIPMNYRRTATQHNIKDFSRWVTSFYHIGTRSKNHPKLLIGLGGYLNTKQDVIRQIQTVQKSPSDGYVIYSYQDQTKDGKNILQSLP